MVVVATQVSGDSEVSFRTSRYPLQVHLDSSGSLIFQGAPSSPNSAGSSTLPLFHRWNSAVASAFLPAGYPSSVTPDYLSFQLWDTIQALSSYVRGMLSTQAMLQGIGVGSATATAAGAVVQFFFRDAIGLLAGVIFAAMQGSSFDAYAKQWRLTADVANDIGLAAELAAPVFPSAFLALACLGSVCRAVTGVAGGATRMALTQHFALQGNAADIAAKENSQETAVTLLGMVFGLLLTRLAAANVVAAWIAFFLLTVLHVYANVKAMRCLCINRLNPERLGIIVASVVEERSKRKKGRKSNTSRVAGIPSPSTVAALERLAPPVLYTWLSAVRVLPREWRVVLAPQLHRLNTRERKVVANYFANLHSTSMKHERRENSEDANRKSSAVVVDSKGKQVFVFLGVEASDGMVVESFFAAKVFAMKYSNAANNDIIEDHNDIYKLAVADVEDLIGNIAGGRDGVNVGDGAGVMGALEAAGWSCDRPALFLDTRVEWCPLPSGKKKIV